MKKPFVLIILLLLCGSWITAYAVVPGDTVEVKITIDSVSTSLYSLDATFSFDENALEYVNASFAELSGYTEMKAPAANDYSFAIANFSYNKPLTKGVVYTLTFKVKQDAKAGKHNITIDDCIATDENGDLSSAFEISAGAVTIECTNHTWDNGTVQTPASCKQEGVMLYACTNGTCGETKTEAIEKLTTHTPGTSARENEVPATCKDAGSYDEVVYCSVCSTEISRTAKVIDKLTTHTPGTAIRENEVPATCKEAGSYDEVVYCSICGVEISRTAKGIDKLTTHTPGTAVRENEVPATCKDAGSYDEVVYCSICGVEISRTAKVIDKLTTHTPGTAVRENEVPATCKDAGSYDEVVYCSVCSTEISRTAKVIDTLTTHTPSTAVRENEVPATCKEAGSYDEVVYCSVCETEIARTAKTIDKLTTHTDANSDYTCDVCGTNLCLQHTPDTAVRENEVSATCKDAGSYDEVVYCTTCNTELSRTAKVIDKLTTHTPDAAVRENEIPATCKAAGSYDEVVYCSVCDAELSRIAKVIDKLTTHTPGAAVRENEVPATCKDAGSYDEVVYCSVCGEELSRAAKAIDKLTTHTPAAPQRENEIPETCKDEGSYDEVIYCSVCGTEISRTAKTIDKVTTHTDDDTDEICDVCGADLSLPVVSKVTVIGGSGSGDYTEGDTVSISADTADATKVFKGWSNLEGLTLTLGNATTSYLSFIMPDHDVTITAEFEMVETYTVSFNGNGGTGSMEAVPNVLGEYMLPECKFVAPAGKQFKGWALAVDGEIITDTYTVACDVTLYAIWKEAAILPEVTIPTAETLVDVNEGETGTMSITATNATAYQWYINRNDGLGYVKIDGATTSTYTTSAVNLANDGYTYYCVASNATGSVQSPIFTLNVIAKVVIPETGDNSHIGTWFVLMLFSIAGFVVLNSKRQTI